MRPLVVLGLQVAAWSEKLSTKNSETASYAKLKVFYKVVDLIL